MQFELTKDPIDEIMFFMEDSRGDACLDTIEGIVIGGDMDNFEEDEMMEDSERYISLPEWDTNAGFELMESFTLGFDDIAVQRELNHALGGRKGVFRAFKDTLCRYPEAEKQWYAFKEKAMREVIVDWYNNLREEWGLERIDTESGES